MKAHSDKTIRIDGSVTHGQKSTRTGTTARGTPYQH